MATNVPPFANEAAYATVLGELVKDAKSDRADADFIDDALRVYAEHNPAWETTDIGDGSKKEWDLTASPFGSFLLGYSDQFPVEIEELDSSDDPQEPPVEILDGWRLAERYSTLPYKALVFETAPSTTAKYRVKWQAAWTLVGVPEAHQMAVVYLAANLKCLALVSLYRSTVDAGSDLFIPDPVSEGYKTDARIWRAKALTTLGVGAAPVVTTGRVRTRRARVFHRRIP